MLNYRVADIVQFERVPKATMLSRWCGLIFFLSVISSKQGGGKKKKRYNKRKYQRGWKDWCLKKVSVYTDTSRASSSRYEKDIVIQGGISDSKKVNKLFFSYQIILCLFLSTGSNAVVFFFSFLLT